MKRFFFFLCLASAIPGCVVPREASSPTTPGTLPDNVPPQVTVHYTGQLPVIDGKLEEPAWHEAEWITLDGSRPALPDNEGKWQLYAAISGNRTTTEEQFRQRTRAAVLWNKAGLCFGLTCEDADVQSFHGEGDWIWIGDVFEIFLAPRAEAGAQTWEFQINPANARFMQPFRLRPVTATHVSGTLNQSGERDLGWSAEIFLPWEELEKFRLARRPTPECPIAGAVRFAAWDLTIHTQLRLNRFTTPGEANPHRPEHYRPLNCSKP